MADGALESRTMKLAPILAIAALFTCGCRESPATSQSGTATSTAASTATSAVASRDTARAAPHPARILRPDHLRGLYVNRWAALGDRMWELIGVAQKTEVNALVIDVKDDRGLTLYKSRVKLANQIGADTVRPMSARRLSMVLDSMRKYNVFPIARIVVAKDPLLAGKRLDLAIKRRTDGKPWLDKNGKPWLDPTQRAIWQYAVDLAHEAYDMGFSDVQFDYVRFPDDDRVAREATFPLARGRLRADVIHDQLTFARAALKDFGMPLTIDVFGLTATDTTDMGIGQQWEKFVDRADVVLPMVYPSHFAPGTYKLGNPNAHPYSTIDHALKDMKDRSAGITGAARIIPWYQDFTLGPPHYNAAEVKAQIKAGYDNGVMSWVLWNPGSRYHEDALARK